MAVTWAQLEAKKHQFPGQDVFLVSHGDYNALIAAIPTYAAIVSSGGGKKTTTYVRQPYLVRTIIIEASPMANTNDILFP